ncbi:hypothetical protein DENSPDRAFT_874777 [Dentipellis sp. KUC8613]|nr:hypothetical protein DENSPDRAFT_874777 [Dentipellis sp. KUC8613]
MFSHSVHGAHHAESTSQPIQSEAGHQSTQNPHRTTWSEPYYEKVHQEHLAVLAESRAVSKQFFSGHMTIHEYGPLRKQYMDRLDALSDELDKELKKETPSMVQTAMDWGYSAEDAEKMCRDFWGREKLFSHSRKNGVYHRRDVRAY